MKDICKAVGTVAIWGGVSGLAYLFHSFNILSGMGASLLTLAAFLMTIAVWEKK